MVYIGIDPGKTGGWAITHEDGHVDVYPWNDEIFIACMQGLHMANPSGEGIICALEKVGSMPKQGVSSTFRFGEEYGLIQGVLKALNIPYQTIPPQTWKKEFSLLHQDKSKSVETAKRLFPGLNFLPTERCRKPSDGMCESALLMLYARRKL